MQLIGHRSGLIIHYESTQCDSQVLKYYWPLSIFVVDLQSYEKHLLTYAQVRIFNASQAAYRGKNTFQFKLYYD